MRNQGLPNRGMAASRESILPVAMVFMRANSVVSCRERVENNAAFLPGGGAGKTDAERRLSWRIRRCVARVRGGRPVDGERLENGGQRKRLS